MNIYKKEVQLEKDAMEYWKCSYIISKHLEIN